jgi:hypothetical protein
MKLTLSRETVRNLAVKSSVRTGFLAFQPPVKGDPGGGGSAGQNICNVTPMVGTVYSLNGGPCQGPPSEDNNPAARLHDFGH